LHYSVNHLATSVEVLGIQYMTGPLEVTR